MVELAIFGALLLVVLSIFIRFGLTLTYQHELTQEGFRKVLPEAWEFDGPASFTLAEDRLMPDASTPFVLSPRSRSGGGGSVLWGRTLLNMREKGGVNPSSESPIIIEVNNERFKKESQDFDFEDKKGEGLSGDQYKVVEMDVELAKQEREGVVSSTKSVTETEQITSYIQRKGKKRILTTQTLPHTSERDYETPVR